MRPYLQALVFLFSLASLASVSGAVSCPNGLTTVSLQLKWLQQAQFAGYIVAQSKGFYAEQCIALSIVRNALLHFHLRVLMLSSLRADVM
jgi:ABC-type nitrate/sulfonate/bicarbonate transport system substrate-binding protein